MCMPCLLEPHATHPASRNTRVTRAIDKQRARRASAGAPSSKLNENTCCRHRQEASEQIAAIAAIAAIGLARSRVCG